MTCRRLHGFFEGMWKDEYTRLGTPKRHYCDKNQPHKPRSRHELGMDRCRGLSSDNHFSQTDLLDELLFIPRLGWFAESLNVNPPHFKLSWYETYLLLRYPAIVRYMASFEKNSWRQISHGWRDKVGVGFVPLLLSLLPNLKTISSNCFGICLTETLQEVLDDIVRRTYSNLDHTSTSSRMLPLQNLRHVSLQA